MLASIRFYVFAVGSTAKKVLESLPIDFRPMMVRELVEPLFGSSGEAHE